VPSSKQRRDAERRRLQRRVQRRAEREARRRRFALIGSVIGTVAVIAIVVTVIVMGGNDTSTPNAGGKKSSSSTPAPSTSATTAAAAYPCTWQETGTKPAKPASVPPTTRPARTGEVNLLVQTSQGPMTFQLNRAAAPCAVESFTSLAQQNYFANAPCHRLTSGSLNVLQCGDPTGTGTGGPGYEFNDELTGHEKYTRGVIAMANGGPNTNGSQFFIVYKNSTLQPNYTIFGKVTSGLSVVDKVAAHGSNPSGDGKPKLPIEIKTVAVVQ
jgi:peptidyl-prolyl cis-trans isomerase B (cyclophilin B)